MGLFNAIHKRGLFVLDEHVLMHPLAPCRFRPDLLLLNDCMHHVEVCLIDISHVLLWAASFEVLPFAQVLFISSSHCGRHLEIFEG